MTYALGHVFKPVFDGLRPSKYLTVDYELSVYWLSPLFVRMFSVRIRCLSWCIYLFTNKLLVLFLDYGLTRQSWSWTSSTVLSLLPSQEDCTIRFYPPQHYSLQKFFLFTPNLVFFLFLCSSVGNSSPSLALIQDSKIASNSFRNFTHENHDTAKEREISCRLKVTIRNLCMLLSAINKPMCNKISSTCIFLSEIKH